MRFLRRKVVTAVDHFSRSGNYREHSHYVRNNTATFCGLPLSPALATGKT
jgi:hypothetical protein